MIGDPIPSGPPGHTASLTKASICLIEHVHGHLLIGVDPHFRGLKPSLVAVGLLCAPDFTFCPSRVTAGVSVWGPVSRLIFGPLGAWSSPMGAIPPE